MLIGAGLGVVAAIGQHMPGLAIGGTLHPVAIDRPALFPVEQDARGLLGRAEIDLPPLVRRTVGSAPAAAAVPVHRMAGRMPLLRRRGRRRLALRQVYRHELGFDRLEIGRLQVARRPERAARDQIEVRGRGNRLVVVAQRRAKHPRAPVVVRPDARFIVAVFLVLRRTEHVRRGPDLLDPVQLPGRIRPGRAKALHDRVRPVAVEDAVRVLRAMLPRGDAAELEPLVRTGAVAMHRAVQHDRWHARAVRLEDAVEPRRVLHVGEALVVDHHVVALGPVGIFVERDPRIGAIPALQHHGHLDVGPLAQALGEDVLLRRIVMATAAGDQQYAERFDRRGLSG